METNHFNSARNDLLNCISTKTLSALPYLLLAQLQLLHENEEGSKENLEYALSLDFTIQNHPIFLWIKATLLMSQVSIVRFNLFIFFQRGYTINF